MTGRAPSRVRAARLAVLAIFFVNGTILSSWAPYIPVVQERLGLGTGLLGVALLGLALGAMLAMPLTGFLVARYGSRTVTAVSTLLVCFALALPVLAPNLAVLIAGLVVFGICNGSMDVAMNAQAVTVERRYRRPTMSLFHGFYSIGGLVGSSLGGLAIAAGLAPAAHVLIVAVMMAAAGGAALVRLLPDARPEHGPTFARPTGPLLGLGLLAFFALLGEGAIIDWSAVYLRSVLGTGAGLAAAGYAAFSLTMAVGRLTGDRVVAALGPVRTVRVSALLAAVGLGAALLVGQPLAAVVGFGCVGLGVANLVPVLFSAAGSTPGLAAGTGIAAVASAGYFGLLAGPPVIGLLAEVVTLPWALGLVVASLAVVAAGGALVRRSPEPAADAAAPERAQV